VVDVWLKAASQRSLIPSFIFFATTVEVKVLWGGEEVEGKVLRGGRGRCWGR